MEETIKRLLSEGYSIEEIQEALINLKKETSEQPVITGDLDEYLDSLSDEENTSET